MENEPSPIFMLCKHETPALVLIAKYGCFDDEPIYAGDTVIRSTTYAGKFKSDTVETVTIKRNGDEN